MADDPTAHAIDVVAHRLVASGVTDIIEPLRVGGTLLTESDTEAIRARVNAIIAYLDPMDYAYDAAVEHLTRRGRGADQ